MTFSYLGKESNGNYLRQLGYKVYLSDTSFEEVFESNSYSTFYFTEVDTKWCTFPLHIGTFLDCT